MGATLQYQSYTSSKKINTSKRVTVNLIQYLGVELSISVGFKTFSISIHFNKHFIFSCFPLSVTVPGSGHTKINKSGLVPAFMGLTLERGRSQISNYKWDNCHISKRGECFYIFDNLSTNFSRLYAQGKKSVPVTHICHKDQKGVFYINQFLIPLSSFMLFLAMLGSCLRSAIFHETLIITGQFLP